jgi:hypothetical protein
MQRPTALLTSSFLPTATQRPQPSLAPGSPLSPTICVSRPQPARPATRSASTRHPATQRPAIQPRRATASPMARRNRWTEVGDALIWGTLALPGVQFLFQLLLVAVARGGMLTNKLGTEPGIFAPEIVHHAAFFTFAIAVWGCFLMRLLCTIAWLQQRQIRFRQCRLSLALLWLGPPMIGTMFWLAAGRDTILGTLPHAHPPAPL